jgi:chromatin remodeling complex protein RSC6
VYNMPAAKVKNTASKTKGAKAPAITVETVETVEAVGSAKTTKAKITKAKATKAKVATSTSVATTAKVATDVEVDVAVDATNNVVAENTTESWDPSLGDDFAVALNTLAGLRTQISQLQTKMRVLQKRAEKDIRIANKAKAKRKGGAPRAPSGFVKPTPITEELANFLGKTKGTEMARTDVTREINAYIRDHNLQDPSNGRRILPDAQLRKLLRVPEADELTYFNLQRYMSPHFIKHGATISA